jgi:glucose-6-phosphate isomerase
MTDERLADGFWCIEDETLGLTVDLSSMALDPDAMEVMAPPLARAMEAMAALESGAVANPDEGRRVGHYWLRAPELAPEPAMTAAIEAALAQVRGFAARVHAGELTNPMGGRFTQVLVIGIGGSTLGPQYVSHALGGAGDAMRAAFIDNTDPDGIDRVLARLRAGVGLAATLTVVISKSGGTKETRNGMLEVARAYERDGLSFPRHAVAVTGEGSALDQLARADGWREVFPMWDWVGGRTSELSAVGLLPAALQGLDIDAMLAGARAMDAATRRAGWRNNPAGALAVAWYLTGDGHGDRAMVVLPYKDRLEMFSRYLQQLVMESLGKERDLAGATVQQGIAVYGNKGSTDQHAFVQQLRDGRDDFFVTFIEVLRARAGERFEVDPGVTSADYLFGYLEGTRRALAEKGRPSLTVTLQEADARGVGMLIALYERAVGLYASLVGINAYDQPGVEAGKRAANEVLAVQARVEAALPADEAAAVDAAAAARAAGEGDVMLVARVLRHLAHGGEHAVARVSGTGLLGAKYCSRRGS